MLAELERRLTALAGDGSVRALVLTGNGPAFCAGADVDDPYFDDPDPSARAQRVDLGYSVARALRALPLPTVCAVNGACVAIGVSLAALCDVRIAAVDARFFLGFARVGIFPDLCASVLLPRLLGTARALELTLLDEALDAERAAQIGLVGSIVPAGRLLDEAVALATTLSRRSGTATRLSRDALHDLAALSFTDAAAAEAEMVKVHLGSRDLREGIAAVRERRRPRFIDR
jgi:2-(1,2-epoxy-1,2-dihydrophenyl)acetyl-CoA isomerase